MSSPFRRIAPAPPLARRMSPKPLSDYDKVSAVYRAATSREPMADWPAFEAWVDAQLARAETATEEKSQ